MKLAILISFFLTSIASAAMLPLTTISAPPSTGNDTMIFYPGTAHAVQGRQPRTQKTNAELLKLGQPLAKPVKLYDAVELAKRLTNAPPQASAASTTGAGRNYRFLSCASSVQSTGTGFGIYTTSNGEIQQKVNECATRSQADGPASGGVNERFSISSAGTGNCLTKAVTYQTAVCNPGNYAIYEVIA